MKIRSPALPLNVVFAFCPGVPVDTASAASTALDGVTE